MRRRWTRVPDGLATLLTCKKSETGLQVLVLVPLLAWRLKISSEGPTKDPATSTLSFRIILLAAFAGIVSATTLVDMLMSDAAAGVT